MDMTAYIKNHNLAHQNTDGFLVAKLGSLLFFCINLHIKTIKSLFFNVCMARYIFIYIKAIRKTLRKKESIIEKNSRHKNALIMPLTSLWR